MSWVVDNLTKQLKAMVLRKTDIGVELHDLNESIKVLSQLISVFEGRELTKHGTISYTENTNHYRTKMYVE